MGEEKPEVKSVALRLPAVLLERIRRMAYWSKRTLASLGVEAFTNLLDAEEKKRGKLRPIPKGERVKQGRPRKTDRPT